MEVFTNLDGDKSPAECGDESPRSKFCFGVDAADRPGILRLRRHEPWTDHLIF